MDDSGLGIDLDEIDQLVSETEQCLIDNFSDGLPTDPKANCLFSELNIPDHSCLKVKVASDWFWSDDGLYQVLPAEAPMQGCIDKGLVRDTCHWRGGLQGRVIVTTPSMIIFKDPLIRLITGCNGSWFGGLEKCASK